MQIYRNFNTLWLIDLAGYEVLIDADGVIWVRFDA